MKILRWTAAVLVVAGCAGLRVDPSARGIKTVAFVGLFMNQPFRRNRADDPKEPALTLKNMVSSDVFILDDAPDARRALLERAKADFYRHLSGIEAWRLLPAEDLASRPAFQAALSDPLLTKAPVVAQGTMEAAPGMLLVSAGELSGSVARFEEGKPRNTREVLARLAGDLGVDAVAVVQLDMAYSLGKQVVWNVVQGRPDVGSSIALVTKEGVVAVKSGLVTRFLAEPIGLVVREKSLVSLAVGSGPDPLKAVKSYARAVDASAEELADDLGRKLSQTR